MYCKNCGNVYEDNNQPYCNRCGAPRGEGTSYCENCGEQVYNGQPVCNRCGRPTNNSWNFNGAPQNNGWDAQPSYAPVEYKSIVTCLILSFITCGIYQIIWYIRVTDNANVLSGDYKTSGGMSFLYSILTCGIYNYFWAYRMGEKLDDAKQRRGIPAGSSAILYLIIMFLCPIVVNCLAQNEINKFANR